LKISKTFSKKAEGKKACLLPFRTYGFLLSRFWSFLFMLREELKNSIKTFFENGRFFFYLKNPKQKRQEVPGQVVATTNTNNPEPAPIPVSTGTHYPGPPTHMCTAGQGAVPP
jgi:hypothetical protein